jgi:hypothetical protein
VSPANGTLLNKTSVAFSWKSAADPDGDHVSYRLDVDTEPDFEGRYSIATDALTETLELANQSRYYWRAGAWDGYNLTFSGVREFSIGLYPDGGEKPPALAAPLLVSPAEAATLNASPLLEWQGVNGASSYNLIVWKPSLPGSPVVNASTSSTSYNTSGRGLSEGTYLWKVRASGNGSESPYSAERSFRLNFTYGSSQGNETGTQDNGNVTQAYCGDGTCGQGEACSSCPDDCGACPAGGDVSGGSGGGSSGGGSGGSYGTGSSASGSSGAPTGGSATEQPKEQEAGKENNSIVILDDGGDGAREETPPAGLDLTGLVSGLAPYAAYVIVAAVAIGVLALFLSKYSISWV